MTNETSSAQVPAGWYPDHTGLAQLRWWDGAAWTEHVQQNSPVLSNPYQLKSVPSRVTEGTPVYNPFIWIITLLPLVSMLISLTSDPAAQTLEARTGGTFGTLPATLLSLAFYGASVVLAYFDRKHLLAVNYDRPFHWAWSFLGSSVYVIGRSIIVRRRSGRGFATFWAWLSIFLVGLIIAAVQISVVVSTLFTTLQTNA